MRKKLLCTFIAALLIASTLSATAFADSAEVAGDGVNLRSGPGVNFEALECLPYGAPITILEYNSDGWYMVRYKDTTGYMAANLLRVTGEDTVPNVTATGSGRINGMNVSFLESANSGASVLGQYNTGKELLITEVNGDFVSCVIDGLHGYVAKQYVTVESADEVLFPTLASASDLVTPDVSATAPADLVTPDPTATTKPAAAAKPAANAQAQQGTPGIINGDYVSFRIAPSTDSVVLNTYNRGKDIIITGDAGNGWSSVLIDGEGGYVASEFVLSKEDAEAAAAKEAKDAAKAKAEADKKAKAEADKKAKAAAEKKAKEAAKAGKISGQDVVNFALQYEGYNYRWGGKDPSTGFDCSGFTSFVYEHFGFELNRVAGDQASNGTHVDAADLQPGDILCFYSGGGYIGHVGLYIGDNKFIHAANSSSGVIISSLDGYYAVRGFTARRIL